MKKFFLFLLIFVAFSTVNIFPQQNSAALTGAGSEITLNVDVFDVRAKPIAGLDKNAFTVTVDNQPAEIAAFISEEPAEILFLLDKSKAMSDFYRKLNGGNKSFISELISRFMQSSHQSNSYSIFAFRKTQEHLLPSTRDQNNVLAAIARLDSLDLEGSTSYVDACYAGIENLRQSSEKKRALVIFTRGDDSDSKYSSKQLINALKENNVQLYFVLITERLSLSEMGTFIPTTPPQRVGTTNGMFIPSDKSRELMAKFDGIDKLTGITGGRSFFPQSAAEMADIFSRLGNYLRHQYTLGIKPTGAPQKGKPRRIKVKVKTPPGFPNAAVRNREEILIN